MISGSKFSSSWPAQEFLNSFKMELHIITLTFILCKISTLIMLEISQTWFLHCTALHSTATVQHSTATVQHHFFLLWFFSELILFYWRSDLIFTQSAWTSSIEGGSQSCERSRRRKRERKNVEPAPPGGPHYKKQTVMGVCVRIFSHKDTKYMFYVIINCCPCLFNHVLIIG